MKSVFWIFFIKTVLLTPDPINIGPEASFLNFDSSISAATDGATIRIDVSHYLQREGMTLIERREFVRNRFSEYVIKAQLSGSVEVHMTYQGHSAHSADDVHLILRPDTADPTNPPTLLGHEWSSVELSSDPPLNGVLIYWRNFSR